LRIISLKCQGNQSPVINRWGNTGGGGQSSATEGRAIIGAGIPKIMKGATFKPKKKKDSGNLYPYRKPSGERRSEKKKSTWTATYAVEANLHRSTMENFQIWRVKGDGGESCFRQSSILKGTSLKTRGKLLPHLLV